MPDTNPQDRPAAAPADLGNGSGPPVPATTSPYKAGSGRRRKRRRPHGPLFYPLVSAGTVVFVLALWYMASRLRLVNPAFLPSPRDVWDAFVELSRDGYKGGTLPQHIMVSMRRLFLALGASLLVAVPLGLAAGTSRLVRAVIDPVIEFYRPLPPLAYYTLLILFLGIGDESKVTLLFLSAFAPLLIGITFAVRRIPEDRLRAARSLGAGGFRLLWSVVLPSCLPDILTGFRTSTGLAYATLVAAEMVAAVSGLGWLVLDASKFLRNDIVFMGVIILGAIALLMDIVLRAATRWVSPWLEREEA